MSRVVCIYGEEVTIEEAIAKVLEDDGLDLKSLYAVFQNSHRIFT